ncbi:hypothetical protein E2562_011409 [Oryza meyeriana var. granulata]|uniref:Uncharacterized protein n=1 Tax=Oryza meyeriana var. granulata TaxID=110450 RepID=A0A6G1D1Z7_9ORYZ|nr:hypothetical protein E2562_011409 [Oryza meyeriana var. granulata]
MARPAAGEATRRRCKAVAAPEKHLNRFVRIIAFIERAGNGLGTLVFTWATVVILGGFSTMLTIREFNCATLLALLEATRMFSQNSRLEYQFFFRTRGAFRRPRLNRVALIVCVTDVMVYCMAKFGLAKYGWIPAYQIGLVESYITVESLGFNHTVGPMSVPGNINTPARQIAYSREIFRIAPYGSDHSHNQQVAISMHNLTNE